MRRSLTFVAAPAFVILSFVAASVVTEAWSAPQDKTAQKDDRKKEPAADPDDDKLTAEERKEYEAKGCGPKDDKHSASTDKKSRPLPTPPADKALVYVVRPTMMGNKIQTKLAVDGKWVGVNRGNNYFFVTLDPGEHYLCSTAENRSVLKVTVEPGKTYFLQQKVRMGFMKATNRLELIDDSEGKIALGKTHLSSFTQKK
jgi:Protein of unknown function (DUF2846)